jgi:hypothetical protein
MSCRSDIPSYNNHKRRRLMSQSIKPRKNASHVDAWAIAFVVILVVAAVVFWTSHH